MQDLSEVELFSQLDEEQLKALKKITVEKKYYADEVLFFEGEAPRFLYVLIAGRVRLYKTDSKNNEVYLHQFLPTSMVAEVTCFESIPYPATARFVQDSQVLKIDYEKFKAQFLTEPEMCVALISSLTKKIKVLSEVIHKEMILSSEAKVACFISKHHDLFDTLKSTQIASILNISPETLSRMLHKLQKSQIIKIDKKHSIEILSSDELKILFT